MSQFFLFFLVLFFLVLVLAWGSLMSQFSLFFLVLVLVFWFCWESFADQMHCERGCPEDMYCDRCFLADKWQMRFFGGGFYGGGGAIYIYIYIYIPSRTPFEHFCSQTCWTEVSESVSSGWPQGVGPKLHRREDDSSFKPSIFTILGS